ncbi:MAG: hypothetical protein IKQ72_02970 [Bacteroidaceae bacterium]|nr:hypothetical protein [Bacteroidaceae bacterium]
MYIGLIVFLQRNNRKYVDDTFITSPDLAQRVAELFRTTHPFIDFINRAVDFEE